MPQKVVKYSNDQLREYFTSVGLREQTTTRELMLGKTRICPPQKALDEFSEQRGIDPNFFILKKAGYFIGRERE